MEQYALSLQAQWHHHSSKARNVRSEVSMIMNIHTIMFWLMTLCTFWLWIGGVLTYQPTRPSSACAYTARRCSLLCSTDLAAPCHLRVHLTTATCRVKYLFPTWQFSCSSVNIHGSESVSVETTRKTAYTYNIINLFNDAESSKVE
jgi:hypothetical protein